MSPNVGSQALVYGLFHRLDQLPGSCLVLGIRRFLKELQDDPAAVIEVVA